MEKFKIGDVVVLNSGGPPMTISNVVDSEKVECVWFEEKKILKNQRFKIALLKFYKPPRRGVRVY